MLFQKRKEQTQAIDEHRVVMDKKIDQTNENIAKLNDILDNGITLKIKKAMGHNAR